MPGDTRANAGYLTPMLAVADVERSIRFYELLGFMLVSQQGSDPIGWARMHCEGGAVMFLRSQGFVNTAKLPVILYMYTPDLAGLRERIIAADVIVPPIQYPEHMRSGEITLVDPDGYTLGIAHWGETEHQAWLKRIGNSA